MGSMQTSQRKAIRLAEYIVSDLDINDIWHTVTEGMTGKDYDEICDAVDPRWRPNEKRKNELYEEIRNNLPTEELKKSLWEYEDLFTSAEFIRQIAFFYLGFSAARKVMGWFDHPDLISVEGKGEKKLKGKFA